MGKKTKKYTFKHKLHIHIYTMQVKNMEEICSQDQKIFKFMRWQMGTAAKHMISWTAIKALHLQSVTLQITYLIKTHYKHMSLLTDTHKAYP